MAARSPRQIVHRGVVEAAAILVDEALAGPREARRRVVAMWSPGATVHRLGEGLLLRFPAPRRVECAHAPGLPLVRTAASAFAPIASAPLQPDELAAAAPPSGSVLLVRGGALTAVVPAEADREDPARWLDLDGFAVLRAVPLGAAPAAPKIVVAPTNDAPRKILGVAEAPSELASIAAAVARLRAGASPSADRDHASAGGGASLGALSLLASVLAAFGALIARLLPSSGRALPSSASSPRGRAAASSSRSLAALPAEPAGPTLLDRLSAGFKNLVAQLLVRARLAALIGRRQAEYLGRLLDMLDEGDLDAALRHAIPLGGEGGDAPVAPALGVPTPRADLSISLGPRRGVRSAIATAEGFYELLRKRYRAAFERLEREGRIDEAAFVLAELLKEAEEAVSFLERHGRLRLAAELAEARKLHPGLVVRQWFLAGEVERAVLIARRHGAFSDALVRLGQHERAPALRVLWAETLAEAGDFAAAVDVIWPFAQGRALAHRWIDLAVAQGGVAAARMLVKKLALVPDAFADVREKVLPLLADEGPRAAAERRAFAEALVEGSRTDAAQTLARPALRALIRDGARAGDEPTQRLAGRLNGFAGDAPLRVDAPSWPTVARTPLDNLATPRAHAVDAADTGAVPILDAAYLPSGRIALALGEAGVRVLGRDGRPQFHLDQPAHRLVVSDRGDRALALAPRGRGAYRLARIDLVGRRTEVWCDAPLDVFAPDFDGAQWVVARGDRLFVIDALDQGFSALLELEPGANVVAIGRHAQACTVVTSGGGDLATRVRYELPSWFMRQRKPKDLAGMEGRIHAVAAATGAAAVYLAQPVGEGAGPPQMVFADGAGTRTSEAAWPKGSMAQAAGVHGAWIAGAAQTSGGVEVRVVDQARLVARFAITLAGASRAALRLGEDTLTVADDRGRLLVVDLVHGGVLHDLRI
jgi:hypothetical protein